MAVQYPVEIVDLSELVELGPQPADWLIEGWLYKHGVHWLQGVHGHGKTFLALWLCVQVMDAGGKVLYLDEENGRNRMAERLATLGATPEEVHEQFLYVWEPNLTRARIPGYRKLIEAHDPQLVVFDSVGDFMEVAELSENSNPDALTWVRDYVRPVSRGRASLCIDHAARRATLDDGAVGATAKGRKADVSYRATRTKKFSREVVGSLKVEIHKDRDGYLRLRRDLAIGGTPFRLREQEDLHYHLQPAEQKVYDALPEAEEDAVTASELSKKLDITPTMVRRHLTQLLESDAALEDKQLRGRNWVKVFWRSPHFAVPDDEMSDDEETHDES